MYPHVIRAPRQMLLLLNILSALAERLHAERTASEETGRLLATIEPPEPMKLPGGKELNIQSAVPTFGPETSYIALILDYKQELWDEFKDYPLFCSGKDGAHRSRLKLFGGETDALYKWKLVWQCPWPMEEATHECFEIFLEAKHEKLGTFQTCRNPELLKQYNTAACVTSVWDDPKAHINSISLLPQWMEFNRLHGVEHFLVYTMTGTDPRVIDIYKPYLEAGLATRVHLDLPSRLQKGCSAAGYCTQLWFANDCLYRMKGHATWLLPTNDVDEFWRFSHQPQAKNDWDSIVTQHGEKPTKDTVHSISYGRYNFLQVDSSSMQISSKKREPELANLCPKFVVQVAHVNVLFVHWPTSYKHDTVALGVPESLGAAAHYRTNNGSTTTSTVDALVSQAPEVQAAVEKRFGVEWKSLVAKWLLPASSLGEVNQHQDILQDAIATSMQEMHMRLQPWIEKFNSMREIEIITLPSQHDLLQLSAQSKQAK